eukprot:180908-Amphidinium_carterae.1
MIDAVKVELVTVHVTRFSMRERLVEVSGNLLPKLPTLGLINGCGSNLAFSSLPQHAGMQARTVGASARLPRQWEAYSSCSRVHNQRALAVDMPRLWKQEKG